MQLIQKLLKILKIVIPLILISFLIWISGRLNCGKMEKISVNTKSEEIKDSIIKSDIIEEKTIIDTIQIKKPSKKKAVLIKPKKTVKKKSIKKKITKIKDAPIKKIVQVEKERGCGCNGKLPSTVDEAHIWAFEINKCARKYIRKEEYGKILKYAEEGISLYENSSLFYLKSLAYFNLKEFDRSLTAAEVSKSNNDYWIIDDKRRVYQLIIDNLKAKDYKTPSSYIKQLIIKAEKEYEKTFN